MLHLFKTTLVAVVCCISFQSIAQSSKGTKDTLSKSYFKADLSFLSNSVYLGRKDSLNMAYITPSIAYHHKSGLFANASLSYLISANNKRIDLYTLEVGYDFSFGKNFYGNAYLDKYFYNASSNNVQALTNAATGTSLTYEPKGIVAISAGVDFLFSDKTDAIVTTSLAHNFYIGNDANYWTITPTVALNAGTQSFYQAQRKRVGGPAGGGPNNLQITGGEKFNILNYEISVPVTYDANKWGIFFTPSYALPQSPVVLRGPLGNIVKTEKLENNFYAELGVYIIF